MHQSSYDKMTLFKEKDSKNYSDGSDIWQDCVLICKKENYDNLVKMKDFLVDRMLRCSLKFVTF